MRVTTDDLLIKIGLQTVEIDWLKTELERVTQQRDDLAARIEAASAPETPAEEKN